jgi:dTDP-glucose 4,6-dehydratase
MTVVVTGGAGFIGSALVRQLVAAGERVVTIDKLTYAGNLDNLAPVMANAAHTFIQADICDGAAMRAALAAHRPRAIYHLAAESHVDRSIDAPADFVRTNVSGTATLLEAATEYWRALPETARGHFRFLNVSTDEVYGELGPDGLFTEASPYRPNSPYAASKAGADHLARAWHRTFGLPVLVSNCGNNFGPYQFPEKLIPLTILNALEGKRLPIYGRGDQVRDWIHVDDHASALRAVVARGAPGETYLIGARGERRNIDVVRAICSILDGLRPQSPHLPHEKLVQHVTDRPGHDSRYAIDPAKCETELGWKPEHGFVRGLRDTVAWYIENRDWCEKAAQVYSRGRIGLGGRA